MRYALSCVAFLLLSGVNASAQVAATPEDEAYCNQYYRFGASGRLNCVLNSRLEHARDDRLGLGFPRGRYAPDY